MKRLAGRVAIVTGAADGPKAALGGHFARALACEGAAVVAADRNDCASVVADIQASGGCALAMEVDVSDEAAVKRMVAQSVERFGRVDILVNNAAVGSNIPPIPIEELSTEVWDDLMSVNVRGPFLCAKAVLPVMRRQAYGKIINIGSTTMIGGLINRLHYVTSKGAILAMTRALARELGPQGIRVNTLALGIVMNASVEASMAAKPGQHESMLAAKSIKKDLYPADIVGTLIFLSSADSDAVTGQFILVNQGSCFS